jgi:nucleoside-diphosphate-sugar epimerase
MKIPVLGGDGFSGWPTSLHRAACGHEVIIVNDRRRRTIDRELALENRPERGERVRICNQLTVTDVHGRNDLFFDLGLKPTSH